MIPRFRCPQAIGLQENREDGVNPSRAQRCKDDASRKYHWLPSREGVCRQMTPSQKTGLMLLWVLQGRAAPPLFTHRGLP
jgi:hypothetical protein